MRRIERKGLLLTAAFSAVLAGFGRSLKRFLGHLVRLNHSFIKQVETFSQRCPHPTTGFLSAVGLRQIFLPFWLTSYNSIKWPKDV